MGRAFPWALGKSEWVLERWKRERVFTPLTWSTSEPNPHHGERKLGILPLAKLELMSEIFQNHGLGRHESQGHVGWKGLQVCSRDRRDNQLAATRLLQIRTFK